ncbi:phospholipase D-like domain-containing protein, partial [Rectinema subterraneum]
VFLANRNEFNAEIYDALIAKAAEGVPVYFLFDATSYERVFHNPKWNDEIVAPSEVFRGTKVKWAEFNPLRLERIAALPWLLVRDHRKIVMVDGEIIYAGGYNLNIYSFAPLDQNGNEDAMVEIQSPDAGRALAPSLAETWNQFSVESLNSEDIAPSVSASPEASAGSQTASTDSTTSQDTPLACPPNANKGAVNAWLGNQVIGKTRSIEALYRAIFDYAQEEVWLVQAFAMPTETIMQMVKQALQRGIQVNIMLSEDQISSAMDKAVHYTVLPLLEAGAHVFIYKSAENALLHYKLAMMDRKIVALGSPNFNYRSVRLSNEIVFVFDNERTIGVVSQNLSELQKRARPVSIEEAQKWRGFSYFMSYLLSVPGG